MEKSKAAKSKLEKNRVTKSFSTVLSVKKRKEINTHLPTNMKLISNYFYSSNNYKQSMAKIESFLYSFFYNR